MSKEISLSIKVPTREDFVKVVKKAKDVAPWVVTTAALGTAVYFGYQANNNHSEADMPKEPEGNRLNLSVTDIPQPTETWQQVPTNIPTERPLTYEEIQAREQFEKEVKTCYKELVEVIEKDDGSYFSGQCWDKHEYWGDYVRVNNAVLQPLKYNEGKVIYRAYCEYGNCAEEVVTNTTNRVDLLYGTTGYIVFEDQIKWPTTATPEPSQTLEMVEEGSGEYIQIQVEVPNLAYSSGRCILYRFLSGKNRYGTSPECEDPTHTETQTIEIP